MVAIPTAALLAAMAVFYQFEEQADRARAAVEHTFEVRAEIRQVLMLLVNAETGTRGYLLTRRRAFLQPYLEASRELPAAIGELHRLLASNPAQLARLNRAETLESEALQSLEEMRRDAAAHDQAAGMAQLEAGRARMDELRSEVLAMESQEQRLLVERTNRAREAEQRLQAVIFAGGGLGFLGGLLAALFFTTSISRRVVHVEEDARRVARGEPVTGEEIGRDEIARLHETLKQTSEMLAAQSQELRAAHADLELRVQRRTAELMAANEALRQANEVRQTVIQSSPLAIWAVDSEGKVTFWNPAAERIFGWTAAEVIGRPAPILMPGQEEEFREWMERFQKGESLAGIERTRQRKDGSKLDVLIWTAPLRDAAGNIDGTLTIDSDITGRKVLEEQFRQSQKLEAVGRLAGGVAHDFNNLLTVIMGYVEMILMEAQDRPHLLDYAHEVQYAANRATSLTAQLLAFSRRQISQPRVLDLNEVVAHSMKLLRRVIGEDVEIATHLDPNLARVKADPSHVDQLIMNLVVNARDAMPGGGKLTIETANVSLGPEYVGRHLGVAPGPYCMLAISDTGTGMTPEVKSRLFEPFFTTKEPGKGTGLGLSIVYGIVKQSDGEVMVYSEAGKGTTFKVYLPVAEVPADFVAAEELDAEARGTETVLVCEDEASIRKLVEAMLSKQGYTVLDTDDAQEAIRRAREHGGAIDLLVTDLVMPHTSGFDLAKTIREIRPDIKVLYMSGYTDNQVSGSWVLDPHMPFLQKPFTAGGLARKVREALGGAQSEGSASH